MMALLGAHFNSLGPHSWEEENWSLGDTPEPRQHSAAPVSTPVIFIVRACVATGPHCCHACVSSVDRYYFLGASTCLGGFMKSAASKKPSAARMATGMNASSTPASPLNILLEYAATKVAIKPPTP